MRQPQVSESGADTYDDIFGPPRTHSLTCTPPRHRITMISASYRRKEERRKVLKMSLNKLKRIEDPEGNLRRSVLINNTTLRLQQETREEKKQKQKLNYPLLCDNDIYSNISNEMLKTDSKDTQENDCNEHNNSHLISSTSNMEYLDSLALADSTTVDLDTRKRKFDDICEESSEEEVLSQFLITPTPTLLTEIDDKPNLNENENEDLLAKRLKLEGVHSNSSLVQNITYSNQFNSESNLITSMVGDTDLFTTHESLSSNLNSTFSCGQASMFGEQSQNNFYYNLVASLET